MNKRLPKNRIVCFTLSLLLLVSLSGCLLNESPIEKEDTPTQNPAPAEAGGGSGGGLGACNEGDIHHFSLATDNIPDVDYTFFLMTGTSPFYPEDCLCDVQQYELIFTDLPDLSSIMLLDLNNTPLPFDTVQLPNGMVKIVFYQPDELPDAEMTVNLSFLEGTPILQEAGGLCVIDNVDLNAVIPFTPFTLPIRYTHIPPPTPPFPPAPVRRAFIPTAITTP